MMGCPPTHEEQSKMDRERAEVIKRANETGGVHCDPSAAPTRAERMLARGRLNRQEFVTGTLQGLWDGYLTEVTEYAEVVFEQSVVPFCAERGWDFSAGMGTWCTGPPGEYPWEPDNHKEDEEWQKVAAILATPVEGYGYDLGSIMPGYQSEEE